MYKSNYKLVGGVHTDDGLLLQILSKILLLSGEITNEEWQFFLKGAIVLDRTKQPPNPAPLWIKEEAWDNVTGLAEISPFEGLVS